MSPGRNFIVLDTQVIIDLLNQEEDVFEAMEILQAIETYDATIGLTIFTAYELFKNVNNDNELYRINHFLANRTDFIIANKLIDRSGDLNPEKWDSGKDATNFDYAGFKELIYAIKQGVQRFYMQSVAFLVLSIIAFTFFVAGVNGRIDYRFFVAFSTASSDAMVLEDRNRMVMDIVKEELISDSFHNKKKSKNLLERIIERSFNALSGDVLDYKKVKLKPGDVAIALKTKSDVLKETKKSLRLSNSEGFVDSFFKHINRKNEDSMTLRGLNYLFNRYVFGRHISINDFIDISNIECIDMNSDGVVCYYYTREGIWNNEFVSGYLDGYSKTRILSAKKSC